ncbi:A/G-specific adenine glycosylase [Clostridium aminobutyricum]|uniref:Adenine DNA glycosylase n=1 Tax=Clostridium aminobutyricum TaxID=33953 RepID=A0A939D6S8_CLOAM|nr:A/G-specific adenine glycosylase [Clostridium aminobutyricum]
MKQFQSDLLVWYDKKARVLPWRSEPTPYRVWISEMMLQQTRVDTVIPYFMRFLTELPTIQDLAEVEEDKLLKLWQGLGYYNRALNLKKAAQIIVSKFAAQLPSEKEELVSLPGIGPYSAGAIASIAFGKAVPAVDGNVLRILSRLLASKEDITNTKIKKELEEIVTLLVPAERPGDFNQALMDLGATICLPNGEPQCTECPVQTHCKAYKEELTSDIPVKSVKKARAIDKKTVFVIIAEGKFALRKRDEGGLLPNLWEFPNVDGYLTQKQSEQLLQEMGITLKQIQPIKMSKHIFSHREWHMKGYFVEGEVLSSSNFTWATEEEIRHQYSIPTAFKAFMKYCQNE